MFRILFFGQLRETLQCHELQAELSAHNISELRGALIQSHPQWQKALLPQRTLCAVNQAMANERTALKGDEEVAFFPPVTGG